MHDELKRMKRVLRRLGYVSPQDVIETKGRVACELTAGDELVLTELIFQGMFNDLDIPHTVALLSCFIFDEKTEVNMSKIKEAMIGPIRQVQETARRIAKVESESKVESVEAEEYAARFKPALVEIMLAWCSGVKFVEICKITEIFEGSIIRAMRRLEELLRQLQQAAKVIGNTELENKFAQGITQIKRDIVFAASLYL